MPCPSSGIWATKSLPSSGICGYHWWEHSLVAPFLLNSLDYLLFYWLVSIPLLNYGILWETYPNLLLIPSSILLLELFAWLLYPLCFTSPFSTFISASFTNRKFIFIFFFQALVHLAFLKSGQVSGVGPKGLLRQSSVHSYSISNLWADFTVFSSSKHKKQIPFVLWKT